MSNIDTKPTGEGSALRNSFKLGQSYILVRDVKNPKADRRQKYDWTAHAQWLAGTRFRIIDRFISDDLPRLLAITTGKWECNRILLREAPAELLAALVETKLTLSEELQKRDLKGYELEILENLIATGVVSLDQVIRAGQGVLQEVDAQ